MATPPRPLGSTTGSSTPSVTSTAATPKPDATTIAQNLGALITMDAEGRLNKAQIVSLRKLISEQARSFTIIATSKNAPNPLLTLAPHLNPSSSADGHTPLLTTDAWNTLLTSATMDAKRFLAILLPKERFKEIVDMTTEERTKLFEGDTSLKIRFTQTVNFHRNGIAAMNFLTTQRPNPNGTAASASASNAPRPTGIIPGMIRPPAPQPQVPPRPVESDDAREKRVLNQWLGEFRPGLDYEVGVDTVSDDVNLEEWVDVLREVLDSFVQDGMKGAVRLAKHRKANKVELKDMAFYLDHSYNIDVPGFNVHTTDKAHTSSEGDKKRRVIPSRGARSTKTKEE